MVEVTVFVCCCCHSHSFLLFRNLHSCKRFQNITAPKALIKCMVPIGQIFEFVEVILILKKTPSSQEVTTLFMSPSRKGYKEANFIAFETFLTMSLCLKIF